MKEDVFRPGYTEVLLERLKVGLRADIGAHTLDSLAANMVQDPFLDRCALQLRAYVLAERLPPETITQHVPVIWIKPATWRDHWKLAHGHRWWVHWWVRRRPARTVELRQTAGVTVNLQRYITYPKANLVTRGPEWAPVRVATWSVNPWSVFDA